MKLKNKDGVWKFAHDYVAYSIPSRLYPTPNNEKAEKFTSEDVTEINDMKILKIIDSIRIEEGRCHENCKKLQDSFVKEGYDSHYYTGWLFIKSRLPIYHSWIILYINDEKHLVDSTNMKVLGAVEKLFMSIPYTPGVNIRERTASLYKEEMRKRKRNTDKIATGVPLEGYAYLGVDTTFEETLQVYSELIKTKEHPSYQGGMTLGGDSVMQQMIKNKKR